MAIRHRGIYRSAATFAMALVATGCSGSEFVSAGDDTQPTELIVEGSSDPGSFVGRPAGGGDATEGQALPLDDSGDGTDGDGPDADGLDEDGAPEAPDEDATTEEDGLGDGGDPTADLVGTPSEDPGLSTDPDVVYFADTCFTVASPGAEATEIACDQPHVIEIYAIKDLPGGPDAPFMGLEAALSICNEDFQRITGVGLGLATIYTRSVLRPSEETWADGERDVTCYVRYPMETSLRLVEIDPVRGFGLVSIYGMEVGDCYINFEDSETTFDPVPCDEPHDAEVFIDEELPAGAFPGDEVINERADELCFGESFESFVGRDYESSSVYSLRSRPNQETWNLGDRTINCLLTDELVRTGSFEGTGL